ncbi:MAG: DUF4007 family protein [Gomphosphaeria aponina SAG 52.96 = DSM 107014]|uniref:DUF4007 family protein n=1 Tax=Gomphosphaeria aponina SAG 52.96 = DSM 107014 TaxID=1521640 RepID=A0A941GP22_9CHRO|nr:DUF4007 family protein [Gomphosphaeria aponina SAG 52.96 = DSM 107014]
MAKLQLSFHTTFALKKEDIIKVMQVAASEKGLSDSLENLMEQTGLGNKKITPMKTWTTRAGLLEGAKLSSAGEIVWKYDPQLESSTTEWLMHFYLSLGRYGVKELPPEPAEWGGWTYFVYDFMPQNGSFSLEDLVQTSASIFEEENNKKLMKNLRILLRAYTEAKALAGIKYVQKVERNKYMAGEKIMPNTYMVGYLLAKIWERDFGEESSVLTDDILHKKMGLGSVLGIGSEGLQEQLDKLESLSLIEQRRSVSPYQVIRRWDDALSLLEKAYENTLLNRAVVEVNEGEKVDESE